MNQDQQFTSLLSQLKRGDESARDALWELVYSEMKRLAQYRLAGNGPVSITPTALVHEVYLKLGTPGDPPVEEHSHFIALVCKAMRYVLADHARKKGAQKRGLFVEFATLNEEVGPGEENPFELVLLNQAIEKLERLDHRLAQVVECRYFGGLSTEESASALGLTPRTVERLWSKAKLYLYKFLQPAQGSGNKQET